MLCVATIKTSAPVLDIHDGVLRLQLVPASNVLRDSNPGLSTTVSDVRNAAAFGEAGTVIVESD